MLYFYSTVSIVDFEQVNVSWVLLNPSQVLKKDAKCNLSRLWFCCKLVAMQGFSGLICSYPSKWVKVFKNGSSEICGRQPLKNLKWN